MQKTRAKAPKNQFRIIAGKWRGRKISFPAGTAVRPTGARIRETLFNWLSPEIEGMRCLDLFAGSGALGLEALSRDAREVVFVDKDRRLTDMLAEHLDKLGNPRATIACQSAESWLAGASDVFDLVFLDPPFGVHPLDNLCKLLSAKRLIRDGGYGYLEMSAAAPAPQLPAGWAVLRDKQAGRVRFQLVQYHQS